MSHHPSLDLLEAYALGQLDLGHSVAVSAHLEFCPSCRRQLFHFEELAGQQLAAISLDQGLDNSSSQPLDGGQLESSVPSTNWDTMLDEITVQPQHSNQSSVRSLFCARTIEINGIKLRIPRVLQQMVGANPEWRSYAGKVWSLPLHQDESGRVNLLYIGPNVLVPQHTHKGTESTLVLHGGFSDEDGEYHAGDFLQRDASIKHSPQTSIGQDCLCLTVLTDTMVFTQGIARLFNLFGRGVYP
ncbi:ChrR family anti-sigma-E factor [Vibrio porteresiae]|uniref:ChrR family anti-sigma-E factor n=1 Tax=Vibrio porteresiae DSM 19223 TaxID=1123496 RepID=A0ABZ0QE12_9VIBR|nr:ChrR family anti-sigma-E factor [Vibrio porteresiae]WPC74709.1 ChrR family anti-sigma-E factor [Vibrio porteresiae DSM 19223]